MTMRLLPVAALLLTFGGPLGCPVPPQPPDAGADVTTWDAGAGSSSSSAAASGSSAEALSSSTSGAASSSTSWMDVDAAVPGSSSSSAGASSGAAAGVGEVCRSTDADGGTFTRECQAGLLCCYPCGIQGCDHQCRAPCDGGAECISGCPAVP